MEQKYRDYLDFIEDAQAYNNLLVAERKLRLPFIDSQTGVAQNDCSLWRSQNERNNSNGRAGTLYTYPALKWQKCRREYLMKSGLPTEASELQTSRLPCTSVAGGEISTSSSSLSHTNHQIYSAQQNSSNSSNSLNSPSPTPTRADSSSGSHTSCGLSNMQDSDSRDPLQFATSQPFSDSPSRNHVSEINRNLADSFLSEPIVGRNRFSSQHELNGLTKATYKERQQQFEAQTKAAIRFHSKMSNKRKKRDAGQSLMRNNASESSNSILIKNGRHKTDYGATTNVDDNRMFEHTDKLSKTTENEGQEFRREVHDYNVIHHDLMDEGINQSSQRKSSNEVACLKSKAIITNGSRPYVCSICDQTYKTRPGLSYHFLHTHNTTLPKNLSNMRIATRQLELANIDSSFSSSASNNSYSSAGGNKSDSNEKSRELQSILLKEGSRFLRSGRVMRSQERSRAIEEDDEKTEEEDYGDIDQTNKELEQSKSIRKKNNNESNTDHYVDCSLSSKDRVVKAEDNSKKLAPVAFNNSENNTDHSPTSIRTIGTKTAADEKVATIDDQEHQQCDNNLFEIYRQQNNLAPPKQGFDVDYINFNAKLATGSNNEPVLQQKNAFCDLLSPEAIVD